MKITVLLYIEYNLVKIHICNISITHVFGLAPHDPIPWTKISYEAHDGKLRSSEH